MGLALRMCREGFEVRLFTNENHVEFARSLGVEAEAMAPDSEALLHRDDMRAFMKDADVFKFFEATRKVRLESLPRYFPLTWAALDAFAPELILTSLGGLLEATFWAEEH